MPYRVRTIARPPTVGSPRPPLQRLPRSARRHRRVRPAWAPRPLQVVLPRLARRRPLPTFSRTLRRLRCPCILQYRTLTSRLQLPTSLLNYSHSDWEQAQREYPLCDAIRRYIQLGCPPSSLTSLCDHIPSHQRPDPADILDLAAKGRLIQGDHDTILLVRNHIAVASSPDGPPARVRRPPFNDSVRIYVPLLARPWIMHACHADASCHLGVMRTLKMFERFYWWVGIEACTKWWVHRCLKCQARKTSRVTVGWPVLPVPLSNSHGVAVSVDYFGPLPITARGNSYILLFTDRFSRRADMFAVTTAEFTAEGTANIVVNRFIPLWGCPSTLLSDKGPQFCARLATAVYARDT